jgi:hypothetical protein
MANSSIRAGKRLSQPDLRGEILQIHAIPRRDRYGSFHHIGQLTHVPRPGVPQEAIGHRTREARDGSLHPE